MKKFQELLVVVLMVSFVGCGGAQKTTQQAAPAETAEAPMERFEVAAARDAQFDFAEAKKYAWAGAAAVLNDPDGIWTIPELNIAKEVQFLIDRELRDNGYTEVAEGPDVLVVYSIMVDMDAVDLKDVGNDLMFVETVPAGALYVALVDVETEEAVWVGAAASQVDEKPTSETAKQRLDYAVTQIMAKLPK